MNKIKFFTSSLVALALMFSLTGSLSSASVEPSSSYIIVKAKEDLKAYADSKMSMSLSNSSLAVVNQEQVNYLLAKSAAFNDSSVEPLLEKYGVYKLNLPENIEKESIGVFATDNSNITMSKPSIYYDATTKEWVVVGGGYWHTDKWIEYIPSVWGFGGAGSTKSVGGTDGFGVAYTSTGGKYTSLVKSSYAYMSDGSGNEISTTVRADGDGKQGFGFKLQDKLRKIDDLFGYFADTRDFTYIGKHFAGLSRYDSNFTNYSGVATSYYLHTYSEASISSLKFGISGKTAGLDFTITNSQYSFPGFSSDTRF